MNRSQTKTVKAAHGFLKVASEQTVNSRCTAENYSRNFNILRRDLEKAEDSLWDDTPLHEKVERFGRLVIVFGALQTEVSCVMIDC